ncbi:monofunctional biosynthetic peptidoglycan transglycosylase [Methylomonas sp. MED-D]|uniref:monofunctional biosynthetic peptidoglycan transglycosylase n=1 Tax=unclassified Methylomonas TaxID=2608980 RepID=UPI0028A3C372|nr:monofunctional biosynthetic peptidoglycan transglycosylase [Methylomonas sp. MV1]MDT4330575.1 monofunctional biosynthetic peptidoglycan transglycosylase [Methylomonas sp. MV1]
MSGKFTAAELSLRHFRHPERYRTPARRFRPAAASSWWRSLKRGFGYAIAAFVVGSVLSVAVLRYLPPPTSAFMLNRHWEDWQAGKDYRPISQQWVDGGRISPHAYAAVVASEDQLFFQHNGFDVEAIGKAWSHHARGGKLRGASTISQQVAKNLFLSPARNWARKALEIWFTVLIEAFWSKQRILEIYLNIAEFGDHLFGVEAASRRYFGVPAQQMTPAQAALLAATLPNPLLLKADRPSAYVARRQSWILAQMRVAGR